MEWVDESVPGYPQRPVPRDEDAAKALKKRTLTNLYNGPAAVSGGRPRGVGRGRGGGVRTGVRSRVRYDGGWYGIADSTSSDKSPLQACAEPGSRRA